MNIPRSMILAPVHLIPSCRASLNIALLGLRKNKNKNRLQKNPQTMNHDFETMAKKSRKQPVR